jgi:hypothetical protein
MQKFYRVVIDMFPPVVGFPIVPTVIGIGGIAPSSGTGIPTHSTPDGNVLLNKY